MKNFVIYGCGLIAKTHAAAIKSLENATLLGCSDVRIDAAKSFAETHSIACYEQIDDILADKQVDVVCICTPSGTHAELAVKFLSAGKNVIVEKPMALNTADCDKMIDAAEKNGAKITVISQMRTSEDVRRAREIVKSGALGQLVLCDLYMKYYRSKEYYSDGWHGTKAMDGGGALMNQGIHGIDLLQYIVGPIKNLKSFCGALVHNIEVEDTAVAIAEYENGAFGVIEATTAVNPSFDRELKIHGTKGYIELCDNCMQKLVIDGKEESAIMYESVGGSHDPALIDYVNHAKQISEFI